MARAKPGQLTCGSPGNATAAHFALEVLSRVAAVDIIHVPFKGDPQLLTDMLGNHVDMGFTVTTPAMPYINSAKITPLMVSSHERLPALANVPTAIEAGLPELEITLWGGIVAPSGTPREIVDRLNSELVKIINSPEVRIQWSSGGAQAVASSPQEFGAFIPFIKAEMTRWA